MPLQNRYLLSCLKVSAFSLSCHGTFLLKGSDTKLASIAWVPFPPEALQEDENGIRYIGNTVGGDGFSVDAAGIPRQPITSGGRCDFTLRIEYHDIDDDDDITARVEQFLEGDCENASCIIRYEGNTVRTFNRDDATPRPNQ